MKVLHVVYNSHPDVTGAAVRTRCLVEAQAKAGVRPIVLSSPFQPPADPAQARGVEHWRGIPHYRCYNGHDPARFMAADKPLWERAAKLPALGPFIRRIRQVAAEERVDLIHAHNVFFCGLAAATAGRLLRLPVVYEIRSLVEEGIDGAGYLLPRAYRLLDRLSCRMALHITVLGEGLKRELIRRGVPESKITVAGNGVDLEIHQPAAARDSDLIEQLGFPQDAFVLGYIGTLVPYEGLDLLLNAAGLLVGVRPQVRVLLVGEGNARPALERQARRLGLEQFVRFAGRLPHEEAARYYGAVDLFVLPRRSSRITDLVTPLKPLEIMAHGKPLLAGDCGGHRELIIEGVNGALFRATEPALLAHRIGEMMAHPERLAQLGSQGRRWVSQNRSWESQCRPVVELYETLLARRRAAGSRVLLVAPAPAPVPTGGVERGVEMILRSRLAERYQIRVWDRSRPRGPRRNWATRMAHRISSFARFAAYLAVHRPRTLHIKSSSGVNFAESVVFAFIGRVLARRVLFQLHSGEFRSWYCRQGPAARWAIRWGLRVPSEILVLSKYWRNFVASLVAGRPIHIVPNGVELPERGPTARRNDGFLHVLTIATLGSHKGHFDILAAATRLRDRPIRFILAGPDETSGRGEGEQVRRRAIDLRLADCVEFAGAVGPGEKQELLADADVFLLPSRAEGMPSAVLEAMAAGLPVVATPVGALPEMLGNGAGGRFIAVGDFEGLAKTLLELLENPAQRQAMGRWNRAQVEAQYSFALVEQLLDALYRGEAKDAATLAALPQLHGG